MGIYLNPGNDGFKTSIQSKIYVDKTELICHTNDLINTRQRYVCVSRPRRFGKSMAAEMLAAYYGKDCDSSEMFSQYKIASSEDYKKHLNQYDVIALNMHDFLSNTSSVDELIVYLQKEVIEDLQEVYPDIISKSECILSKALAKIYSKKRSSFVIIIDEWDCILREKQYAAEEHKKYLDFLRNLMKDKVYVALAYMTGILPVKKYGTHSALNMFDEYSMIEAGRFSKYTGFLEQEVEELCIQHQVDFEKMKEWYDGYLVNNDMHIYNPKSVVDSIIRNKFSSYWTQTETYEALKRYIILNYDGLQDAIVQMLAGNSIEIDFETFQNDMTTFESKDDVLTLLVHLGYLAYNSDKSQVFIPNVEVRSEFLRAVKNSDWKEVINALEHSEQLLRATWQEDADAVAKMIDKVHSDNTSILTYNDENSLSCVISLAYYNAMNEYMRIREMPTGKGFADIVYVPKPNSNKPAMIIELKYDKSAKGAISQIKEKRYVDSLRQYHGDVLLVGINYDKKTKEHACVIERCIMV